MYSILLCISILIKTDIRRYILWDIIEKQDLNKHNLNLRQQDQCHKKRMMFQLYKTDIMNDKAHILNSKHSILGYKKEWGIFHFHSTILHYIKDRFHYDTLNN